MSKKNKRVNIKTIKILYTFKKALDMNHLYYSFKEKKDKYRVEICIYSSGGILIKEFWIYFKPTPLKLTKNLIRIEYKNLIKNFDIKDAVYSK